MRRAPEKGKKMSLDQQALTSEFIQFAETHDDSVEIQEWFRLKTQEERDYLVNVCTYKVPGTVKLRDDPEQGVLALEFEWPRPELLRACGAILQGPDE